VGRFPHNSHSLRRSAANDWQLLALELSLLGDFKSIVNVNSESADGTLQLRVAMKQLHDSKILRLLVNHRSLRTAH
jgi:hypothetical protein